MNMKFLLKGGKFWYKTFKINSEDIKVCKDIPFTIFHTVRIRDLEKIISVMNISGDKEAYLIAPSIGITKKDSIMEKFGELIFIGDLT